MTDQTKPTITPEEAAADLARLEQKAIDGGDVTVADLTAARERITLARLFHKGIEGRAQDKRMQEADQLRAKTKTDVAKWFTDGEYIDPLVAYDQAVAALEHLVKVIDRDGELLTEAYRAMDRGGIYMNGGDGQNHRDFDERNHAALGSGTVGAVVLGGVMYSREQSAGDWVRAAALTVAKAHEGLPIRGLGRLDNIVEGQLPATIRNRAV
ncbi:hypothetical protein [Cryobacterium mannosilyticum]|uniref:Uncharacterized protein n=1 Tax=Cryobacterium mannosilyticum TaxID=1259190 RepID=A0A4R8W6K1_9MICO|nr:hypothetical protein [Cryobacterium mannosilyticum]TFC03638.1 hypothetical protein E3O32_10075 [Cryobacterium mannosilyticum]